MERVNFALVRRFVRFGIAPAVLTNNVAGEALNSAAAIKKGGNMGKTQPAHEIKLGKIRATIWANDSEDKGLWFSVSVTRSYKVDTRWKDSTSFSRDDLPIVVKALELAYGWIWRKQLRLQQAEKNATNEVMASVGKTS